MILFHHAQGRTAGVVAFADELLDSGHTVHVPDLYDGKTFADLSEGVAFAQSVGRDAIVGRAMAAAEDLSTNIVYAGFSLGARPAQKLAQTRPNARGALLFHGFHLTSTFGRPWPPRVPLQIHMTEHDKWCDIDVAQTLRHEADAELFLYRGSRHLFADPSLDEYDAKAARLLTDRALDFLDRLT